MSEGRPFTEDDIQMWDGQDFVPIGQYEMTHEESVSRHPASKAKEDTKFIRWVAAQDWPEMWLDEEEDES